MPIRGKTPELRAKRRLRGLVLLGVSVLLFFSTFILVVPAEQSSTPQAPPPAAESPLTQIIVALIGAIPATITAVAGLILVLRNQPSQQPPTPPGPDGDPPPS